MYESDNSVHSNDTEKWRKGCLTGLTFPRSTQGHGRLHMARGRGTALTFRDVCYLHLPTGLGGCPNRGSLLFWLLFCSPSAVPVSLTADLPREHSDPGRSC